MASAVDRNSPIAAWSCRVSSIVSAGTHLVVIATVEAASRAALPALAYTRRRYATPVRWLEERIPELSAVVPEVRPRRAQM